MSSSLPEKIIGPLTISERLVIGVLGVYIVTNAVINVVALFNIHEEDKDTIVHNLQRGNSIVGIIVAIIFIVFMVVTFVPSFQNGFCIRLASK